MSLATLAAPTASRTYPVIFEPAPVTDRSLAFRLEAQQHQ